MEALIQNTFIELIETRYGSTAASKINSHPKLSLHQGTTPIFDQTEMLALVDNLSQESGIPTHNILITYGEYLFGQIMLQNQSFFESSDDIFVCLKKIEKIIHAEASKLYPGEEVSRFNIIQPDNSTLEMAYISKVLLGDFTEGLIKGCINYYKEQIDIHREYVSPEGPKVKFVLKKLPN